MPSTTTNNFNLEDKIEQTHNWAKEMLEETGEFLPTFIAWPRDTDKELVFTTPWKNDEDKEKMLHVIRSAFLIHNVNRYMLVAEVWTAKGKENCKLMPSERDDRQESLGIQYTDEHESKMIAWPIQRDGTGKPKLSKERTEFDKAQGKMSELLPPLNAPVCPIDMREKVLSAVSQAVGLQAKSFEDFEVNKDAWL